MKKSVIAMLPTAERDPRWHHPHTDVLAVEYRADRKPTTPYTLVIYRDGVQTLACTTFDRLCSAMARQAVAA